MQQLLPGPNHTHPFPFDIKLILMPFLGEEFLFSVINNLQTLTML